MGSIRIYLLVLIAEEARWEFFLVDEDGLHLNYAPVY